VLNKHRDNFTLPLPVGFVTVEINKIVTLNDNVTFVKTFLDDSCKCGDDFGVVSVGVDSG
jgi:hypothetical protein